MSTSASILRVLRQVHLYLGVFIAPALIFFAFTGLLQTAGLQDQASSAKWIHVLAQIHKKQTYVIPQKKPKPAAAEAKHADGDMPAGDAAPKRHRDDADAPRPATDAAPAAKAPAAPPAPQPAHIPEKAFFFLVSIGLFTSTLTGIYMAYRFNSNKTVVTALLILGIVLPLVFLKF